MQKIVTGILLTTALFAAAPSWAQQKRNSPHETISTVVDGSRVMIVYGRPYSKDPKTGQTRKIWGELVPYGPVWRTGADEATLLITEKPLMFGSTTVPAGAYTLWTVPTASGASLVINKQIGQWGVDSQYDQKRDFARIPLTQSKTDKTVDQFTISLSKDKTGGDISMAWENVQYTIHFTVKK